MKEGGEQVGYIFLKQKGRVTIRAWPEPCREVYKRKGCLVHRYKSVKNVARPGEGRDDRNRAQVLNQQRGQRSKEKLDCTSTLESCNHRGGVESVNKDLRGTFHEIRTPGLDLIL